MGAWDQMLGGPETQTWGYFLELCAARELADVLLILRCERGVPDPDFLPYFALLDQRP